MTSTPRAFTLVELLVAMAIIGLLSSMMVISAFRNSSINSLTTGERVRLAAQELATTLEKARNLAIKTAKPHAVVFHIENAGDGRVLKNYSSYDGYDIWRNGQLAPVNANNEEIANKARHWYAIVGPLGGEDDIPNDVYDDPAQGVWGKFGPQKYPFLAEYEQVIARCVKGKRITLPRGTRFLALSDSDLGNNGGRCMRQGGSRKTCGPAASNTSGHYPRPWYGRYDNGTLYPWGGFDRDLEPMLIDNDTSGVSGFGYRGVDSPIPYDPNLDCNINPNPTWALDSLTHSAPHPYLAEGGKTIGAWMQNLSYWTGEDDIVIAQPTSPAGRLVGKTRPLFNANWLDYAILFRSDGTCMAWRGQARMTWKKHPPIYADDDLLETGGFTITIAPDIDPNQEYRGEALYDLQSNTTTVIDPAGNDIILPRYDRFASADAAWSSITPFSRVTVRVSDGAVAMKDINHPDLADLGPEVLTQ